jgi:hypothetical protein
VFRPTALALHLALCSCVPAERAPGERDASRPAASSRTGRAKLAAANVGVESPTPLVVGELATLPVLAAPFKDEFERDSLGDDYYATGSAFHLERGRLCVKGARNHPLWLRHRLPTNARIQVEAEAMSPDGDIKLEAWGDGQAAATRISYTDATSYLAILGGWKNRYHVLARMDEHASDRQELVIEPGSEEPRQRPVQVGHRYRLKLERTDAQSLRFWADDVEILSLRDTQPLLGVGHDHFAFNDWETPVCFDHLVVEPLPS